MKRPIRNDKTSVLIVDDSVTIRAAMEQILLRDPRFIVAGLASNVDNARELMRRTFHEVMTLDLSMPGIGGLEFLDELAARTHAPIVVVSSSTKCSSFAAAEAVERGAFACFDKASLLSNASDFLKLLRKAAKVKRTNSGIPEAVVFE